MFSRMSASGGIKPSGISRDDRLDAGVREHAAERRAAERKQQALDQQLTHEQPSAGAERRADRHLLLARCGAREQHVRDVGARDEQQHAHRREQRVQRRPELPTRPSTQLTTCTVNCCG